jgi:hypothetical protein
VFDFTDDRVGGFEGLVAQRKAAFGSRVWITRVPRGFSKAQMVRVIAKPGPWTERLQVLCST